MVLKASPMHVSNLINPLSGVALVRNSSYNHKQIFIFKQALSQTTCRYYYTNTLTRLSPISHLVLRGTLFGLDATFTDDLETCLNDSPNNELAFRLYSSIWSHTTHHHQTSATHFQNLEKKERWVWFVHTLVAKEGDIRAVECWEERLGRKAPRAQQAIPVSIANPSMRRTLILSTCCC